MSKQNTKVKKHTSRKDSLTFRREGDENHSGDDDDMSISNSVTFKSNQHPESINTNLSSTNIEMSLNAHLANSQKQTKTKSADMKSSSSNLANLLVASNTKRIDGAGKSSKEKEKKSKSIDEERRKRKEKEYDFSKVLEENMDEQLEIAELDAAAEAFTANNLNSQLGDFYKKWPPQTYKNYNDLRSFAREFNMQIPQPEFVLLGPASQGKSTLLEAILGEYFNIRGCGVTKRPLYLRLINNMDCETPSITLKHDTLLQGSGFYHDIQVSIKNLATELSKRFFKLSKVPVVLNYESAHVTNMTFIDLPGIPSMDTADYDLIMEIILDNIRPSDRRLIAVEETADWTKMTMTKLIKSIDPRLDRTIFVYTKFNYHLMRPNLSNNINHYLWGVNADANSFFVSLPSFKHCNKETSSENYQQLIWKSYCRDMNNLEDYQYDRQFQRLIGVHLLRDHILNFSWKSYVSYLPDILESLNQRKNNLQQSISNIKAQQAKLCANQLRQVANNYVIQFSSAIDDLMSGTSEAIPTINGQTLEEEKRAQGDIEWVDACNMSIQLNPRSPSIPFRNSHVYGGQQMERLLSEFKAICLQTDISEISIDDIATSTGINKIHNVPNYALTAADLVYHQSRYVLLPLIEQLNRRCIYIMKRLFVISEKISNKAKFYETSALDNTKPEKLDTHNCDLYPYFKNHLKDLFFKFIETYAEKCKERCLDEFYSSKTFLWEITEFGRCKLSPETDDKYEEDIKNYVNKVASQLFKNVRDRICKNVMLKVYNFIVVPLRNDVSKALHDQISELSDEDMENYFRINEVKDRLAQALAKLDKSLARTNEQEEELRTIAPKFRAPFEVLSQSSCLED